MPEVRPPKVLVDPDGLEASIVVEPGTDVTTAATTRALADAGVTFGIDHERLGDIEEIGMQGEFVVAVAEMPISGASARFSPKFETRPRGGKRRKDGSIDLLDLGHTIPASPGQILGTMLEGVTPSPGKDVFGRRIRAANLQDEGVPVLGTGVAERATDGNVIATIGGVIRYEPGNVLEVVENYQHAGDVDPRTGHLESRGRIVVSGTVGRDLAVVGATAVRVNGNIEGGSVFCRGTISIGNGISGTSISVVSASGDITFAHAHAACVESGGLVTAMGDVVQSTVRAHNVDVGGRAYGGKVEAESAIVTLDAGMDGGERSTVLAVGVPLRRPLRCEQGRCGLADVLSAKAQRGGGKGAEMVENYERRKRLLAAAYVEVRGTVFPGVVIVMGNVRYTVGETVQRVRFVFDERRTKIALRSLDEKVA